MQSPPSCPRAPPSLALPTDVDSERRCAAIRIPVCSATLRPLDRIHRGHGVMESWSHTKLDGYGRGARISSGSLRDGFAQKSTGSYSPAR
jgi:hypothetical protein